MAFTEKGSVQKDITACVYRRPSFLTGYLCTLNGGEPVLIDQERSTECYYFIKTINDIEGYCMIPLIEKGDPL